MAHVSALPDLVDGLVAAAPALLGDGWRVYDGYPVADDPTDFLAVGVEDPLDSGRADSGDTSRTPGPMGTNRPYDEVGTVRCAISVSDGGGDAKTCRDRAYDGLDVVDGWCRTTYPALPRTWKALVADVRLYQDQTAEDGAVCLISFTVAFAARI